MIIASPKGYAQNSRDIGQYLSFLGQHPDSTESDAVRDSVCLYLLEGLDANSSYEDYEKAMLYARSPQVKKAAEAKLKEWKKARYFKRRDIRARGLWSIGVGAHAAAWKNNELGLFATVKFGSDYSLFNLSASLGWSWWNTILPKGTNDDYRWSGFDAVASARVNTGWNGVFVFSSIGRHTAYDKDSGKRILSDWAFAGKDHPSLTAGLGRKKDYLEYSIGFTYDLEPAYDQQKIYESPYYDYYATRSVIDSRWRIEASIIYYFKW